ALVGYLGEGVLLASFVAGMFFTSIATTAPAVVVLGGLSLAVNPLLVALTGGAGAVLGDFVLFSFVRDRIAQDAAYLLRGPSMQRVRLIAKRRYFRRVLPIVGAL